MAIKSSSSKRFKWYCTKFSKKQFKMYTKIQMHVSNIVLSRKCIFLRTFFKKYSNITKSVYQHINFTKRQFLIKKCAEKINLRNQTMVKPTSFGSNSLQCVPNKGIVNLFIAFYKLFCQNYLFSSRQPCTI